MQGISDNDTHKHRQPTSMERRTGELAVADVMIFALRGILEDAQGRRQAADARPARAESARANIYRTSYFWSRHIESTGPPQGCRQKEVGGERKRDKCTRQTVNAEVCWNLSSNLPTRTPS